jgi:peptidoglycan/LPS O-acetylase OafA/YrhL
MLLIAGGALCWFIAYAGPHSEFAATYSNASGWVTVAGFLLISLGSVIVLVASLGVNSTLVPRWLVYLGLISFGLYVFHILAKVSTSHFLPKSGSYHGLVFILWLCATLGLTVAMAALSYRYFETPFLKMKRRHEFIVSRPV